MEATLSILNQDAFHVTVVYKSDSPLLDFAKLNRINSLMVDEPRNWESKTPSSSPTSTTANTSAKLTTWKEPLEETTGNQDWHGMRKPARQFLHTENPLNEAGVSLGVNQCYFAVYHAPCHSNAGALAGRPQAQRRDDWSKVYMGMDENIIHREDRLAMSRNKAAIYVKEAAGYPDGENSKELQQHHCEEFCQIHGLDIVARYYDGVGIRHDFDWMMGEATQDDPPFRFIVVYKLRNFSWSLEETILCRDRLRANGVSLVSTAETSW